MPSAQPKIELLGFADCPNTPLLRTNLAAALAAHGWTFDDLDQESLAPDDVRRGYPTPTVLVNGRDLFGLPEPAAPAMGCRVYPGGVPDAAAIGRRLGQAAGRMTETP
jgi:hypothetical protein